MSKVQKITMRGQDYYVEFGKHYHPDYVGCGLCGGSYSIYKFVQHKCEKGLTRGKPSQPLQSPNERSNVNIQPRTPRLKYSTRFKRLTTTLSTSYFLMAGVNLITFCISIPLAIGDPLALILSVWAVCGMSLSIWAGLWVRK